MCLALALYFEARSEPIIGQLAVAQVILNRVAASQWPDTICKVVWQPYQFSWTHDGKSDIPKEKAAWKRSQMLTELVMTTSIYDFSEGSKWYHTIQIDPYWNAKLTPQITIGNHIFYTPLIKQEKF